MDDFPLPDGLHMTCAVCVRKATRVVVKTSYTGSLLAVCTDHTDIYRRNP